MNSIFIEGKDSIFIDQYLSYLFNDTWKNKTNIVETGGWTKIDKFDIELIKNSDAGFKNYLIFDADSPTNKGGFTTRLAELEAKKVDLGVQFETFLFPNNADDGDYESLLERIINPTHQRLLDCFTQYENCVSQYKNAEQQNVYKLPLRKAKMYSFVDAFFKSRSQNEAFKKGDYSFRNIEYWDLKNPYLTPLRQYLQTILI